MDLKEIREEVEDFGFRKDLTKDEISHIIILTYNLIGEIYTKQNIIDRIIDYCKLHEENDKDNFLRDIRLLINGGIWY